MHEIKGRESTPRPSRCQASKRVSSSVWFEGSLEDEEEEEDGDFYLVEAQDGCGDGRRSESECAAWDVPGLLGLQDVDCALLDETRLSESSNVLNASQIQQLSESLPAALNVCEWTLAYRTQTHGSSLQTLYRSTSQLENCMIVLVKDSCRQDQQFNRLTSRGRQTPTGFCTALVFGAVCSAPLRVSPAYYGTGQTFLFSFAPSLQVFKWTGMNSYFIKGSMDSLLFGGGRGHFGLWLDSDLLRGRSQPCETFSNHVLSSQEDFLISELEVWALN